MSRLAHECAESACMKFCTKNMGLDMKDATVNSMTPANWISITTRLAPTAA